MIILENLHRILILTRLLREFGRIHQKETSQTTNAISPSATPNSENAKVSNDAILDGEGDGLKDRKSHGVSSDASNYNISKRQGNVNNMKKEANLQGEGASFDL